MTKRDYYDVLGLEKSATQDDVKRAYRKLASKYHPDKVTDEAEKKVSEVKFKEANEAYECLMDPQKRSHYDSVGHAPQFSHGNQTHTWTHGATSADQFNDIFSEVFRNHPGFADIFGQKNQQRQEIFVITISLQDAYIGRTVQTTTHTKIHIPKGVRSGTKLYVDGKIYRVDVLPDFRFKRANDDLLIDVDITAIEAMLGVEVVFEHLDGAKLQFTIPAGIQSGQIVKLGNKGMKNPETDRYGDMLVRVAVSIPKTLSDEERDALKQLKRRESINL